MSYFLFPPHDRSDEMEYAYWNGELETKEGVDMDNDFIKYLEEAEAAPREYYEPCDEQPYYPTDEEIAELNDHSLKKEDQIRFANELCVAVDEFFRVCGKAKARGYFNKYTAETIAEGIVSSLKEM